MSILIKGAYIPKCCGACDFVEYDPACVNEWWCPMAHNNVKDYISDDSCRPTFCPLVEIPPHGRLIEKEELLAELELEWNACNDGTEFANKIVPNCIKDAPVIIESEGE